VEIDDDMDDNDDDRFDDDDFDVRRRTLLQDLDDVCVPRSCINHHGSYYSQLSNHILNPLGTGATLQMTSAGLFAFELGAVHGCFWNTHPAAP
jgi:hypothetical protein